MKPWTEARNNKYMKYNSKLTYQLSFWNWYIIQVLRYWWIRNKRINDYIPLQVIIRIDNWLYAMA